MADVANIEVNGTSYAVKDATAARRNVYYGTCTTAANTYIKVATVEPFPLDSNNKPLVGTVVAIKYSNSNSYKTAGQTYQLNVNSTGDYPMYYNNAALATSTSANTLVAGYKNRHIFYMFNGSQWVWLTASYDSNTTYSGMTQAEVDAGTSTTNRLISPQRLRNNFYTEDEVDTLLGAKANSADLATVATSGSYNDLTDQPNIPSIAGLATETYVNTAVSNLVDSAPQTLDTLNELAAALGDDPNFATTVSTELGSKVKFVRYEDADEMDVDTSQPNGTIGYDANNEDFYIYESANREWRGLPYVANLASVAISGNYNDLFNKPTIPAAYDDTALAARVTTLEGQVLSMTYNSSTTTLTIS